MKSQLSLLLASAALLGIAAIQPPAMAAGSDGALMLAQATSTPTANDKNPPDKQKPKSPATQNKPAGTGAATTQQTKPAGTGAATTQQTKPAGTGAATTQQTKPGQNGSEQKMKPAQDAPAAQSKPAQVAPTNPSAVTLPGKPRDANEFLRRDNQKAGQGIEDLRKERRETREGNRVFIREGDRTIVRENNRVIIQHNESTRFAIGARDVRTERRGDDMVTIVERPGGISIVSFADRDGRLIRRVRRDSQGREVIIIDNGFAGPRAALFVDLAPPVIRIPRERYIVEAERATPVLIFETFMAPPVERIERRYTLDQVRFSYPLRERMPRVDLDINFDTGSWQITPDQIGRLNAVAEGLNKAIARNPREVFLIEGHTDAVGSAEDNLSLSDRRAEAVAVALTEQFKVPAENLVTQGYGEQNLKVPTQGAERANRYVAVRRITPLIDQVAAR